MNSGQQAAFGGLAILALLLAACGGSGGPTDDAAAASFAAAQGPALGVTTAQLETALRCSQALDAVGQDPVLLTPAFSTDEESFGWNYLRQLPALAIPVCSLTIPDHGFGDLQNAAEYVVQAVRRMSAESGRRVILLGHQHGPLDQLWALMFWPDIPTRVSSLISLATPYQGTSGAQRTCEAAGRCPPSVWQIRTGSQFLAVLNGRPLPVGPAYTSITTLYDELITPQPEASRREGATNLVLQEICPGRPVEHFSILADNLAYALVLDAIRHPGQPANPSRLPADICAGPLFMPGSESPESGAAALGGLLGFASGFGLALVTQSIEAEPPLRAYAMMR